jgi:hypothetical protein
VQGDTVVLEWEASADASLTLNPPLMDVTAQSAFGVGRTSLVVNATTTFTLTASRGAESTNKQATVNAVSGVAPGWRLIDHFDVLSPGHIDGKGNWQNALSSISGPHSPARVSEGLEGNRFLSFDAARVLAGNALNSLAIAEGGSRTLFFRFFISPNIDLPLPGVGIVPLIDINFGLTEKGLRDVQDFRGGNNGPSIRLLKQGGPIDLRSPNGVNAAGGTYSWVGDTVNNPTAAGLQPGTIYNVWMDVENRPFDVVAGVQNGGDLYSVYLQKEGDSDRLTLFQGYFADRDAVNCDPILGCPIPTLTHLFFAANDQVTPQGTNMVRFDDFFLSTDGFNPTIPIAASALQDPLRITRAVFNGFEIVLTWNATIGQTYSVQKRASLSSGDWVTLISDYPPGGAAGPEVSFPEFVGDENAFFRVTSP